MTPAEQVAIRISGPASGNYDEIPTPDALTFIAGLSRKFEGNYRIAADLFADMMTKPELDEFMTIRAYDLID